MEKGGNLQPLDEPSSVKTVNLFERQWQRLDEIAKSTRFSRSELLRLAVDEYLGRFDAAIVVDADAA